MELGNHYPSAGPARGLAALFYDSLLIAAISIGYGAIALLLSVLIASGEMADRDPIVGGIWFQLCWLATIAAFFCFFWRRGGQTLGMKAWRLRLIDPSRPGGPSLGQCLLRCLLAPLSLFLLGLGYLWCYIDRNGNSLHDRLTGTRVILLPKSAETKRVKTEQVK